MSMKEVIFSMMIEALENIDEAVEVSHDRYIRSHGKKASGSGGWFFTHKSGEVNNLDDEKEVHFKQGKFSDAAKSAKKWAKENGHRTVYVMEEVEIEEGFGAAIKKAEASRQRALKKAASMVKKGFSHEAAAKNHDVSVADLKKHLGEDAEQIDELSKATLGSYIKKAGGTSLDSAGAHMADYGANKNPKSFKKGINRAKGVMKAADRLTKEEVEQIDEISKSTLGSYVKKAVQSYGDSRTGFRDAIFKPGYTRADRMYHSRKLKNREKGISRATDRLTKEDVQHLGEADDKLKKISKKEYDKINAEHSKANQYGQALTKKNEFKYKGAEYLYVDKPNKQHVVQTYSHWDHELPTIEMRTHKDTNKVTYHKYVKESVEQIDEISRDLARSYIRKAAADNKERKADVMKPFNVKDMEKNVSAFKKMKSREKGIETAGKKAYGIGGEPKVPATE